jgi:hypothetical protein
MGKPDEMISWLEKLGVRGLRSAEQETEEKTDAVLPPSNVKRADTSPDHGPVAGRGKLIFEPPIGEVEMLSISPADKKGRVFDVTIHESDKAPLLFQAATDGRAIGTVTISVDRIQITLQDVQVTSFQVSGSTVHMRLDSSKRAEIKTDQ